MGTPTLEQRMLDAGKEHGFHAVSVGYNTSCTVGRRWSANVHWSGFSRDAIACAHGSASTPEAAIAEAIAFAAKKREPYADEGEREYQVNRLREQLAALTGEPIEGLAA